MSVSVNLYDMCIPSLTFIATSHPHHGQARYISQESDPITGEPVLTVDVDPRSRTVKLAFVRSTPSHPWDGLMRAFWLWCRARDPPPRRVALEDDAMFSEGDCKFAALAYRLLRGQPSIYARHGYAPDLGTAYGGDAAAYRADLVALRRATASVWPAVAALARRRGRRAAVVPAAEPGCPLGLCLSRLPCATRAAALNDLGFLAAHPPPVAAGEEDAITAARALLRAHRRVLRAHRCMVRRYNEN